MAEKARHADRSRSPSTSRIDQAVQHIDLQNLLHAWRSPPPLAHHWTQRAELHRLQWSKIESGWLPCGSVRNAQESVPSNLHGDGEFILKAVRTVSDLANRE